MAHGPEDAGLAWQTLVPNEPEPEEVSQAEHSCSSEDELFEICEGGMRVNNEAHVINIPSVPIRGSGSGGQAPGASAAAAASAADEPITTSMGRSLCVGAYSVYVGNWCVIAESAAQVLLACEVDEAFTKELQNPTPIPPVVMGTIEGVSNAPRPARWDPWHVASLERIPRKSDAGVVVAARSSLATGCQVCAGRDIMGQPWNEKRELMVTTSRILVAQVQWRYQMHGQRATQFAMVHLHHKPARKDPANVCKYMSNDLFMFMHGD